ncbi:MAG: tetratricopeptide repeat protein [Candidatus Dependentiae bacterium]|nr:tetratricopeptide repeat protein [Candidatus Dependentiae bacterium]
MKPLININRKYLVIIALTYVSCSYTDSEQEYLDLAKTYAKHNNQNKALEYYQKALTENPTNFEACFNSASIFYSQDNPTNAIIFYKKAIALNPNSPAAWFNVGMSYNQDGNTDQAMVAFKKTIELNPSHSKAHQHLASIYEKQKNIPLALVHNKISLTFDPNNVETLRKTANLLKQSDNFEEAIPLFQRALASDPKNIHTMLDLANTYNMIDDLDAALTWYQQILEINPAINEARYNYAFTLKKQGHFIQAMEIYKELIAIKPTYAQPHFSLSLAYLSLGDFEHGWQEYEWRWAAYNETPKKFNAPLWQGEDIQGKTILLYSEQGLGDTFQFIRYAKLISEQGGTVIFQAQKPLKTILSLCPYIHRVVIAGDSIPHIDYQIPLMSLPLIFKTTVDTVPAALPYLYANDTLITDWHKKLAHDTNFKIGICWQGNANYSTQFLRRTVAAKSIHVKEFAALGDIPGISLYSLQKMNGSEQLQEIRSLINIKEFDGNFDQDHGRFMDTAAVIKNLDLVITVDTSISHFAAALGCPTWILLPEPPDWRWMIDRKDTPWYPNVRLFKQPTLGDWQSVFAAVGVALEQLLTERKSMSTHS